MFMHIGDRANRYKSSSGIHSKNASIYLVVQKFNATSEGHHAEIGFLLSLKSELVFHENLLNKVCVVCIQWEEDCV